MLYPSVPGAFIALEARERRHSERSWVSSRSFLDAFKSQGWDENPCHALVQKLREALKRNAMLFLSWGSQ
jgi:hypothetical protein